MTKDEVLASTAIVAFIVLFMIFFPTLVFTPSTIVFHFISSSIQFVFETIGLAAGGIL